MGYGLRINPDRPHVASHPKASATAFALGAILGGGLAASDTAFAASTFAYAAPVIAGIMVLLAVAVAVFANSAHSAKSRLNTTPVNQTPNDTRQLSTNTQRALIFHQVLLGLGTTMLTLYAASHLLGGFGATSPNEIPGIDNFLANEIVLMVIAATILASSVTNAALIPNAKQERQLLQYLNVLVGVGMVAACTDLGMEIGPGLDIALLTVIALTVVVSGVMSLDSVNTRVAEALGGNKDSSGTIFDTTRDSVFPYNELNSTNGKTRNSEYNPLDPPYRASEFDRASTSSIDSDGTVTAYHSSADPNKSTENIGLNSEQRYTS